MQQVITLIRKKTPQTDLQGPHWCGQQLISATAWVIYQFPSTILDVAAGDYPATTSHDPPFLRGPCNSSTTLGLGSANCGNCLGLVCMLLCCGPIMARSIHGRLLWPPLLRPQVRLATLSSQSFTACQRLEAFVVGPALHKRSRPTCCRLGSFFFFRATELTTLGNGRRRLR